MSITQSAAEELKALLAAQADAYSLSAPSVLSAVARCTTIVNIMLSSGKLVSPNSTLPSSRWPLLLTGRNSVNPCTMPSKIASK